MRILKYFDFYSNEENMEVSFIYREMLHNKKEKKNKTNQPTKYTSVQRQSRTDYNFNILSLHCLM